MQEFKIKYPDWYDEFAEIEHEAKGYLEGVLVIFPRGELALNFYDAARFTQDAADEVCLDGFFYMSNVVIVESVSKKHIEAAVQKIFDQMHI